MAADETNEAYRVAEQEPRGERRYRVTAPSEVHGHRPGESFSMLMDEVQEQRLVESGALVVVDDADVAEQMTRPELDKLADAAGVEEPHKLANKQAVVDEIDAATADDKE